MRTASPFGRSGIRLPLLLFLPFPELPDMPGGPPLVAAVMVVALVTLVGGAFLAGARAGRSRLAGFTPPGSPPLSRRARSDERGAPRRPPRPRPGRGPRRAS